jgi:hypothetical protein
MNKRKFKVGDKVQVIGLASIKFPPGVKDDLGTNKLFSYMLGKVYTVKGFDKYGNVELRPNPNNAVWIEPEFLKLRAGKRRKPNEQGGTKGLHLKP